MRAAAFSYGVLEALADTQVIINGKKRRLLDEVDVISSVSGGSFTASYYGLFGDRVFKDFETKFLKHNVQGDLTMRVLSPGRWPKLSSKNFGRSEIAAQYYDELLFEHRTFRDIVGSKSPLIALNATDMALGSQFTFIRSQFVPICTDILSFPVSRAVTASSAVPGVFNTVILKNHAGTCDYQLPEWANEALRKPGVNTRRYHNAKTLSAYLDVEKHPYIHLMDGGVSDDLGIRPLIDLISNKGGIWKSLKEMNLENSTKLAVIVVNARKQIDTSFSRDDFSVSSIDILRVAQSVLRERYSFETMETLRDHMSRWREAITTGRGQDVSDSSVEADKKPFSVLTPQSYLVEVSFEIMKDESERRHLEDLPTTFHLDPNDVDRLRAAARKILKNSNSFQTLIADLGK
jgi:NTE family protein